VIAVGYQIIDGITSADIAFKAEGANMEELFLCAGEAIISIMIMEPETLGRPVQRVFTIEEDSPEMLLYDYLNEILFYKDSELLLLIPETVSIWKNNHYTLKCTARGDVIGHSHRFKIDIKAVTMHALSVNKTSGGWSATVVVDV
jgi:SHS2 domain-containing protein